MFNPFEKLKKSLSKTKASFMGKITSVVFRRKIDDDLLDEIEEILIESDVGVKASMRLIENLRTNAKEKQITEGEQVIELLKEDISSILTGNGAVTTTENNFPEIWLVVGVNGVGKTTTIGKLATAFSSKGHKVMIAACDTFRAAAVEQISIWAQRSGVEIVKNKEGADPSAVAYDAASAAHARNIDLLLVDTAGRLHTKDNLMEELRKIKRVIIKANPDAKILTKLIIDGTTGQNALTQVKVFTEAVGCDGLIVTKLDGTAKGGFIIAAAEELEVPVDYIGLGEGIDDLQAFDPKQYAEALFS